MTSPHSPFASVGGDEGAGVVRDAHQALRRRRDPLCRLRATAFLAHSSASASSSGLKAPWLCWNRSTASRPARIVNSLRAVAANHALYDMPASAAAVAI